MDLISLPLNGAKREEGGRGEGSYSSNPVLERMEETSSSLDRFRGYAAL